MPVRCARRTRIVIADDHASVRAELRSLLEDQPEFIVVGEASDGLEAMALARALLPDVILMDVSMPNVDGIEATRHIHTEFPTIQIFGLSTQDRRGATVPPDRGGGCVRLLHQGRRHRSAPESTCRSPYRSHRFIGLSLTH